MRAARPDDLAAILELTCTVFGEHRRRLLAAMIYRDSSHRLDQSRVAVVDGTIASYVRVVDRPVRYGAAVVRLAGIGAVATLPSYRGAGLATMLLRDAIAYMQAAGHPLSLLFTDLTSFYARLGWRPFPGHTFQSPLAPRTRPAEPSVYTVRRFEQDRDLPAVETIYDAYNRGRAMTHVRSHPYWLDDHSHVLGVLPAFVALRDGQVVAYASCHADEGSLWISEAACRADAAAAFRPLARALVDEARAQGGAALAGQLPRSHGLLAALREQNALPIEGRVGYGAMLRVNDLHALMRAVEPVLTARVQHQLPGQFEGVALGLRVAGGYVRLAVAQGRLVMSDAPSSRVLDLETGLFLRLFCGADALALVREEMAVFGVRLRRAEALLLDTIFPLQDPVYWSADTF